MFNLFACSPTMALAVDRTSLLLDSVHRALTRELPRALGDVFSIGIALFVALDFAVFGARLAIPPVRSYIRTFSLHDHI